MKGQYKKLLKFINQNEQMTYGDIAQEMGISRYKAMKLVAKANQELKNLGYALQIHMLPYKGSTIEGDLSQVELINDEMTSDSCEKDKRILETLAILLNADDYLTIQYVADQLFVSRTTFERILQDIRQELKTYHIEILGGTQGIKIDSNEQEKRKLLATLINSYKNRIVAQSVGKDHLNLALKISRKAQNFVKIETIERMSQVVNQFIVESGLYLSEFEFSALVIHTSIAIERVHKKFYISPIEAAKSIEPNTVLLKSKLEQEFNIQLPEAESYYLNLHILAIEQNNVNRINYSDAPQAVLLENEPLKQSILAKLAFIHPDNELLRDLEMHIRTAINRIKNKISIRNPYLEQIKEKYLYAFEISEEVLTAVSQTFSVQFTEDEIAFVAIHIQAFFERSKQTFAKEVVLVCGSGFGTAKLLELQLKNKFGDQIHIVDTIGLTDLQKYQYTGKTIISTVPIEAPGLSVIYVKPFIDERDINKITKHIGSSDSPHHLIQLLDAKLFMTDSREGMTTELVLKQMIDLARKYDRVTDGFYQAVMERERLSSTSLGDVAMPHGDFHLVKEPGIVVYRNVHGVDWGDDRVHLVCLFLLNETVREDLSAIYNDFNELISNPRTISDLVKAEDIEEFESIVAEELNS